MDEIMELEKNNKVPHVFYCFDEVKSYVDNAISYIASGVKQGNHILFIENDKIYPKIDKKLKTFLTEEQLNQVHRIDNFDYYLSEGSFHPSTILDYFSKTIEPYWKNRLTVRIWGHVEWGDQREITGKLEEYERGIDKLVTEIKYTTVCAYDGDRLPNSLRTTLLKCHEFVMTDTQLLPSKLYKRAAF
ncbi:MAG TPA: MEDS domain-containing protein [Chondromyces sp.]|nr:MEDS domain-containing protein [Chondromyces sp.]